MHNSGKPKSSFFGKVTDGATFMVVSAIRMYQKTISPDHGKLSQNAFTGCRYYPSCSEYTIRAINERGLLTGTALGAWRILRCNPLSQGGVDESYKKKK